jgi:hypothetical protein
MATTTFSGPIKAGTISNTTGTILGENIKNTGQVLMSQSILISMAAAAGVNTYDVGVIPKNSQIVEVLMRFAIASNAGTSATMSVGKTDSGGATAAFYTAAQDGKTVAEHTQQTSAFDNMDRVNEDTQVTATLTTVGTTSTAGQASVTITYIQANLLQDKAANL